MLNKHLALVLLGTTLVAAPAFAQTNNQSTGSGTSSTSSAASGPMSTGNWMTQEQAGQWRASKLEGLDVYNQNNEKIGDISELLVDGSGKVQAVVVGVGGFLGIGERSVAIPFDQIKFVNEPRAMAANTGNQTSGAANSTAPADPTSPANSNMATNNANSGNAGAPATTGTVAMNNQANNANRSAPDHAMLMMNMSKDQLKAAPEFKYAQ